MRFSNVVLAFAATASAADSSMSICDKYTKALLKENNAKNQYTLLQMIVGTVVIGNYTMPNKNAVPGILAPGKVNGKDVKLAGYFNGDLKSTNRGGKAVSVNFLDGGGADPIKKNMPANDKTSHQYFLMTHLYSFFGSLLQCSSVGMPGFDAYDGQASMFTVHRFMSLNLEQVTYFVEQVGLAAQSFGVSDDDVKMVATALNSIFNVRCGPKTAVIKAQGPQLQSICIEKDCPEAKNASCNAYGSIPAMPSMASNSSMTSGTMTGTMMPTGTSGSGSGGSGGSGSASGSATGTAPPSATTGAAASNGMSLAGLFVGLVAFAL